MFKTSGFTKINGGEEIYLTSKGVTAIVIDE
jgi:hypothetical protein